MPLLFSFSPVKFELLYFEYSLAVSCLYSFFPYYKYALNIFILDHLRSASYEGSSVRVQRANVFSAEGDANNLSLFLKSCISSSRIFVVHRVQEEAGQAGSKVNVIFVCRGDFAGV